MKKIPIKFNVFPFRWWCSWWERETNWAWTLFRCFRNPSARNPLTSPLLWCQTSGKCLQSAGNKSMSFMVSLCFPPYLQLKISADQLYYRPPLHLFILQKYDLFGSHESWKNFFLWPNDYWVKFTHHQLTTLTGKVHSFFLTNCLGSFTTFINWLPCTILPLLKFLSVLSSIFWRLFPRTRPC